MTPIEILEDHRFTVSAVPPGNAGVGWLRAPVVRFCESDDAGHSAAVTAIAACYQPSQPVTAEADRAMESLVEACGGKHDEPTAAVICVLVQAATSTANLIRGDEPPVPSTVRIAPTGESLIVDLASCPFSAGRHRFPGREHALALADGATQ